MGYIIDTMREGQKEKLLSPEETITLSNFLKDMEGTADSQSKSKEPTYNPTTKTFTAYPDAGNKEDGMAIGYGFTEINGQKVKAGDTMSFQEAEEYLRNKIDSISLAVDTHLTTKYKKGLGDMTSNAKLIAVDKAFQLGSKGFADTYINLVPALLNDDWKTINEEYHVHHYDKDKKMKVPTVRRNDGIYNNFIKKELDKFNLLTPPPLNTKFEQQDKKESLEKQKIVYDTMPDLVNAIQTKEIPKEKIKGFITDAASSKLLSEIGEKINVPEFIENLGIDVDVKGKDEFAIKGKGLTYKQDQDTKSISGKGLTYTDTPYDQSLVKEFGKEGDITGSVGISKSDFGDEKTIGGQINIPTDKIFRRRKRR